jgi:hypothetical protein
MILLRCMQMTKIIVLTNRFLTLIRSTLVKNDAVGRTVSMQIGSVADPDGFLPDPDQTFETSGS